MVIMVIVFWNSSLVGFLRELGITVECVGVFGQSLHMLGEDEDTYSYEIWPTPETRTRLFWGIGKGATSAGVDTAPE